MLMTYYRHTYYRYRELKAPMLHYMARLSPSAQRFMAIMEGSFLLVLATTAALYVY